jgi:hypothetical protein
VQSTFPNTPGGVLDPLGVPVVSGLGFDRGLFDNRKINETSLEIDLARYVGFHVGYRYTHRTIELLGEGFDIDPVTGDRTSANEPEAGFQNYKLPEHTALGGLWIQPSGALRFMFDAELSSAGVRNHTFDPGEGGEIATDFDVTGITTFTRITPRHQQQYRGRVTLQPERHVNLGASVNILEARNSLSDIAYRFHNRYYSFNAGINPNDRILVDLAYSYQDYLQNDLICFSYGTRGAITPGTTPGLLTPGDCPQSGGLPAVTSYLGAIGDYDNQSHFGSVMLRVKPVSRLTLSAGYSIISNNGGFTRLNALTPTGPTQFNYHRPLAAVEIELLGGLALKGSYNYYGYNEKGSSADVFGSGGPTIPRDFHANDGTIGLRYTF